jgi:tRNA(Ile2) C34 agmatinyltransferase TiaS
MSTHSPRYETEVPFISAWAEMGSASSRNRPGRRHLVRLSGPGHSVIVATGLSETTADRQAQVINQFLAQVLYDRTPSQPTTCPQCATTIHWSGQGRPPRYCSPACRQQAYRDRHHR